MPSMLSGTLIKEMRLRKSLMRSHLQRTGSYSESNLSRIENNKQNPTENTFINLMNDLSMPVNSFFFPCLENQSIDIFLLRDEIYNLIDSTFKYDWIKAEDFINSLEKTKNFNDGINKQFLLSCKAQLNELYILNPQDTINFVNEGMHITYKEFNEKCFEGDMLIFEEPVLLHMLSKAYRRMGRINDSISLLYNIYEGILRLPEDDREKEKRLAPVLLTLSEILIDEKKYDEALNICHMGNDASIKRNKGKYTPAFLYNKASCYYYLNNIEECKKMLIHSFVGYSLLQKKESADTVLYNAHNLFNIEINTYGIEKLIFCKSSISVEHGESISCDSIGDFIAKLRVRANMTQKELCEGICSQANLNKIENGKIEGNVFYLEAFMQRLGRDINKYFTTFPKKDDFEAKQIRDEIISLLSDLKFDSAEILLLKIKNKKSFCSGVGLQFIKKAEAAIFASREGYNHPQYINMLIECIKITKPNYDEDMVHKYRLMYNELVIINQIAIFYCESSETSRGIKLFERLKESMDLYYIDSNEKIKMYGTILYNLSKFLGIKERYIEALNFIKDGVNMEISHRRLSLLPLFAINKACDLLELKNKKESVPYFVMAFYGNDILSYDNNTIKHFIQERLKIFLVMSRKLCKHKKNKEKAFIKVPETTHQSVPK